MPDGVFAAESPVAGGSSFLALPPPCDEEVEDINRRIARKTLLVFRSIDPAERRVDDDALDRLYAAALQPPSQLPSSGASPPMLQPRGLPARVAYRRRGELLRKVFAIDIFLCDRCSSRRRIVAAITQPDVAHAILRCLGPPDMHEPARATPTTARA